MRSYSLAEARDHLTTIVRDVETKSGVELTRRGRPVAVILSIDEYRRLTAPEKSFWVAYQQFRREVDLEELALEPEIFEGLRDPSSGREVSL